MKIDVMSEVVRNIRYVRWKQKNLKFLLDGNETCDLFDHLRFIDDSCLKQILNSHFFLPPNSHIEVLKMAKVAPVLMFEAVAMKECSWKIYLGY